MKSVWVIILVLLSAAARVNKPAELLTKSKVTLPEVVTKALPEVKEGTPFFATLKEEKGKVIYTVNFAQGTSTVKLSIDALTGEVLRRTTEKKDHSKMISAVKITMAGAIDAAVKKVPGKASRASFFCKKGKPTAEVIVVKDGKLFEVKLDAATGSVIKVEEDDDDDDADDDDDDDDDDD